MKADSLENAVTRGRDKQDCPDVADAYAAFTDLPPEQQSHCDAGFVEHCRDEIVELLELHKFSTLEASVKLNKLRERLHYYRRGFVATCNNSAARGDPLPGTFTSWRNLAASRRVGPVVEEEDPEPFGFERQ